MESNRFINAFRFNKFFWGILCLLLVANLAAYFIVILPQRDRINTLHNHYNMKRKPKQITRNSGQLDLISAKQDIQAFINNLPPRLEFTNRVMEIFDALHRQRLPVDKMSYKPEQLPAEGLMKFSTSITVTGPYASLKELLAGIQNSDSLFCIENLTLTNQSTEKEESVNMNLEIATYFR